MSEFQVGDIVRFKRIKFADCEWDHWVYGLLVREYEEPKSYLNWIGRILYPEVHKDWLDLSYADEDIELVPDDEMPDEVLVELARWRLIGADPS